MPFRRTRTSAVLAIVAAVALLAAGCGGSKHKAASPTTSTSTTTSTPASSSSSSSSSSTTAPAAKFTPKPVSWHACNGQYTITQAGFQCATLQVPLDPQHPGKQMINLALARHVATGPSKGALIYNPGGPGASAVDELPSIYGMLGADLRNDYDFTTFDPPGVGESTEVKCLSNSQLDQYFHLDPLPQTAHPIQTVLGYDKQFAQACQKRSASLLPHVSTVDAATDMEYVRQALGQGKLNYLGFSYGTLLGQVYANLFGPEIRSMVLDGDENPDISVLDLSLAQAKAFQANFNAFAQGCSSDPSCPWKPDPGSTLTQDFLGLVKQVRAHPVPYGNRSVGPSEVLTGILQALYTTQYWQVGYQAIADVEQGDGQYMMELNDAYIERQSDGSYSNTAEAENAVNCLDDPAPSLASVQAAVPEFQAASSVFGLFTLYGDLSCNVWPVKTNATVHPASDPNAPPVLLVGSTGDPATPYSDSQALQKQLTNATLITRNGNGHTGYLSSSCIRTNVDNYIQTLTMPPPNTTCPSDGNGS